MVSALGTFSMSPTRSAVKRNWSIFEQHPVSFTMNLARIEENVPKLAAFSPESFRLNRGIGQKMFGKYVDFLASAGRTFRMKPHANELSKSREDLKFIQSHIYLDAPPLEAWILLQKFTVIGDCCEYPLPEIMNLYGITKSEADLSWGFFDIYSW